MKNSKKFLDQLEKLVVTEAEQFKEDNIEPPNSRAILTAANILNKLDRCSIQAKKIATCAEGGISLCFDNSSKVMWVEIYNDGEMGYITSDGRHNVETKSNLFLYNQIVNFKFDKLL